MKRHVAKSNLAAFSECIISLRPIFSYLPNSALAGSFFSSQTGYSVLDVGSIQ